LVPEPSADDGAKPRIIAHRAVASGNEPQNLASSITAAVAAGADGVELDVRGTRDGALLLNHDAYVRRPYGPVPVRWLRRTSLPGLSTLDEAASALIAADRDRPRLLVIDAKQPGLTPRLTTWVRRFDGLVTDVALWCRDPREVSRARASGVFAQVALLRNTSDDVSSRVYLRDAVRCGAQAVSLHPRAQRLSVVDAAQRAGLFVYAWIIRPDDHEAAVALGVDGLVTDWVGIARAATAR
jgi:glycerophosphoryl diester phosphodiesterase